MKLAVLEQEGTLKSRNPAPNFANETELVEVTSLRPIAGEQRKKIVFSISSVCTEYPLVRGYNAYKALHAMPGSLHYPHYILITYHYRLVVVIGKTTVTMTNIQNQHQRWLAPQRKTQWTSRLS